MKTSKIFAVMAGFLTLMVIAPSFATASNIRVYSNSIQTGERLEYRILAGYAPLDYYDWVTTYSSMANISVETGGTIEATVNGTYEAGSEPEIYLDLVFKKANGAVNQTFRNDSNVNNAINLVLGTWTNAMGIITFVNWTHWNKSLYTELGAQLTKFDKAPTLITIVLNYTDGSQNTTLVYDAAVGVLKYAFTETAYGGRLILQLVSSTIPLPSDAVIPGYPLEIIALSMLTAGIAIMLRRGKRRTKIKVQSNLV